MYEHGRWYQDFPEDQVYTVCADCGEYVYGGVLQRHYMKDHDIEIAAVAQANHIRYLEVVALVVG